MSTALREPPTAATPRRPRRRAVPWLALALWIVALAVCVPLAGRVGSVQRDGAVDYLPASADSTQVAKLQDRLPGGESTDLVVVYHRDGGLTAADRATAGREIAAVAEKYALATPDPLPSRDGSTVLYPISTTTPGQDDDKRTAFVEGVRGLVDGDAGLSAEVGGPGALGVDSKKVYDSLDGPLLYTTVAVVALLLILIYRSPVLWLVPLVCAGAADVASMAVTYLLHEGFGLGVSGQSSGVTTVLLFGVGTDYALLLVARYREELFGHERALDAMGAALRRSGPAILASAGTVAVGMLCLLAADLNSSRGMGPAAAVGVACALAAMTTLLPAVLVLLGRRVFWPFVPKFGAAAPARRGMFGRLGDAVCGRPVAILVGGVAVLAALALGTLSGPGSLKLADSFSTTPESITASRTLSDAYPERSSQPVTVMAPADRAAEVRRVAQATEGVADVRTGRTGGGWTELSVTTTGAPESAAETATLTALRDRLNDRYGAHVGGPSAQQLDLEHTNARDRRVVIPLVLVAVLLILALLLRALVGPLVLIAAVVAVWGAAMGIGALVFEPLFGFAGTDPGLPLLSFVFLVALGVDYGIFLAHRMREEMLGGATPVSATLDALRATGGVITSAGLVLAATFSVLVNMPLVQLAELGFVIAVGVLLDTFVVRTFLVTSAAVLLRRAFWWPGRLSRPGPRVP